MIVVAGPPGSGKSSIFPVSSFGVPYFNADDRAAELNRGSYAGIPKYIRDAVNGEFETFVLSCIESRTSFAIETTLRSGVTFDQGIARESGGICDRDAVSGLARFRDAPRTCQSARGRRRPQRV